MELFGSTGWEQEAIEVQESLLRKLQILPCKMEFLKIFNQSVHKERAGAGALNFPKMRIFSNSLTEFQ